MRKLSAVAAVLAAVLLNGCSHTMGDVKHIDGQTPQAVVDGFNREFPGCKLTHTDQVTYMDKTIKYELKFRDAKNDYKRKMFTADGKLLDSKWDVTLGAATAPAK